MKKIIPSFIFCFLFGECFSQAGEWVWIHGSDTTMSLGSFGIKGFPSPTNEPPAVYESCEWTDLNGNFWLYGGMNHYFTGSDLVYADLWKYDPLTNEWTWMKGPGTTNAYYGHYGTQGVPSPLNNPPALSHGSVTWVDNQGNLWMFGGVLLDVYSALWKYDISTNEWTWMKGYTGTGATGSYGIQGIETSANKPGARYETAVGWTDNLGYLWLFGGDGLNSAGSFNDLWRYNITNNKWTWMKGSQLSNQGGVSGVQGVEDSLNTPGARWVYCHWKDHLGRLWLFGGGSMFSQSNDLWRYNPATNKWAWIGGSASGVYGTKCIFSSSNLPGARVEDRVAWTDQNGNFWMFGGGTGASFSNIWNDLWMYCVATNQWVWVSNDNTANPSGNWGVKGISSPANKPNGRGGAVGWTDHNGHLYFFGGSTHPFGNYYNDLWKYTIDSTCAECNIDVGIPDRNNINKGIEISPNPTNFSLTISFQSSSKQTIELRIYNTLGKEIYFSKEEIAAGKFEKEINVEKLSDGIYFLQLKTKEGIMNKKVIVHH